MDNFHRLWVNKINLGIRKIRIEITVTFEIQKSNLKMDVVINIMLKPHIKTLRFQLTGVIMGFNVKFRIGLKINKITT